MQNDTDVTSIKASDSSSGLAPKSKPSSSSSRLQSIDKDATCMMSSFVDKSSIADLGIGSVIKNTYELVEVLGEGGMGTVFKALNRVWAGVEARNPYVALKVLKPELATNKQLVRGLFSDFDRTRVLAECPNIIKVYGFDKEGSHVYMTMEFLTGTTLADYLNGEPMSLAHVWFIIEGIGNALAYAHQKNIVHRDIKPENIIITHNNIVKVLDFGIASKINEIEGEETLFAPHELGAYTEAYASPEMQLDFAPDVRDDIYAFACLIYEMLTGIKFYKSKGHLNKFAPIQGLNTKQMEALRKSLAYTRSERTGSIGEFLDTLHPAKTSWRKYVSIGGGAFIILGLGAWGVIELKSTARIEKIPVSQIEPQSSVVKLPSSPVVSPVPVSITSQSKTPLVAPAPVQQTVRVAADAKSQVIKTVVQEGVVLPSSNVASKKPINPDASLHKKTVNDTASKILKTIMQHRSN